MKNENNKEEEKEGISSIERVKKNWNILNNAK